MVAGGIGRRKERSRKKKTCLKYLLFAFNLVFVIFGILLLYAGFSTVSKIGDYDKILEGAPDNAAISLITVGFAIFVLAFLGCCVAIKENYCMLSTFSLILLALLPIEVIDAGLVLDFKSKLKDVAKEGIDNIIRQYNESDHESALNKVIDDLQHNLHCCGANNYNDWVNSTMKTWPESCCSDITKPKCKENKGLFNKGCVDAVNNEIRSSFGLLGGIAITVAVIQLIGIIFACSLSRTIRKEYGVV